LQTRSYDACDADAENSISAGRGWKGRTMRISYDAEVDALYIRLVDDTPEVTTRQISEDVAIDYAPDGAVVGIEVLDASQHAFRGDGEPSVILENVIALSA
jgi:uncharacterized protein YuzE